MTEEITNYIISIAPAIGAIATVLVAGIKLIKSFSSNFDTLKKELGGNVKGLNEKVNSLASQNSALLQDNQKLVEKLEQLTKDIQDSNKINENIQNLTAEINATKDNLNNMVESKFNEERQVIEQIRADRMRLGE